MKAIPCIMGILLASLQAFGQSDVDSIKYRLPEVTVSATRSPETIIEVPLAISVIDRAAMTNLRAAGINEIMVNVPGVLAQSRYGGQDVRLTIRGFGARGAGERSNAGTSRGVRVLVDGIPETEPDGRTSFDLIDLSSAGRVEVVRSNASALWGNAAGGIVNILSNSAFDEPFITGQSIFGSYGFRKQTLNSGMMVGNGKLFFSMSSTSFDGWRDHSRSAQTLVRTGFVSQLAEGTRLGLFLSGTSTFFQIPGPLTQSQFDANPRQAQADTLNYSPSYVARDERRLNRLGKFGVTLTHDLGASHNISAMAFVNPKFLQRSERNTFRDFTRYHVGGNIIYRNVSYLSADVKNMLHIGLDEAYQDGAILFYSLLNGERGPQLRDNKREGANNLGVFLQNEVGLGDRWSFNTGLRYDKISYYSENFIDPRINGEKTFPSWTPKAGVTYRISPFHSVYLNIGGGVEVPAGNEIDPDPRSADSLAAINPLLDPIESTTLEIGTKEIGHPEGGLITSCSYDIATYWIKTRNDIIPYQGGRLYHTAGKTERIGFEGSTSLTMFSRFMLQCALTLSRNRYDSYVIDSTKTRPSAAGTLDLSGNKLAGVPEMFYHTRVRYHTEPLGGWFCELSLQGVGSYLADDANTIPVPPYAVMSAAIGVNGMSLGEGSVLVDAFIGVNNLWDRRYAASAFINPDYSRSAQPIYLEPGLPRTFTASLALTWKP